MTFTERLSHAISETISHHVNHKMLGDKDTIKVGDLVISGGGEQIGGIFNKKLEGQPVDKYIKSFDTSKSKSLSPLLNKFKGMTIWRKI